MTAAVSAAGALLWMVQALLEEHGWTVQDVDPDARRPQRPESFAGDANLLPAQRYQPSSSGGDADVHERALLVGGKLFVHFVSSAESVQLSLQLERNFFPESTSGPCSVASDAELSRLPEPLLARIGGFLSIPDFCRVTQTSKYLHQLQEDAELWQQFLQRDYPSVHSEDHPKSLYRQHRAYLKRMEAWNQFDSERRLQEFMHHQPAHWRWRSGGRMPAPPLRPPMPPPFLSLEDSWSLVATPRPPHHPSLFGDEDLGFLHDPSTFYRIADHESEPSKRSLIMCAGKSVYGSTTCSNTGADDSRSDNGERLLPNNNNAEAAHSNQTTHFRSPATAKTTTLSEPHSPPRQRTDEELEQIIRDLRQQVFQQQQQQQQQKQNHIKPTSSARSEHSAADSDQPQKHHRKHLKNPVEKMERVAPTVPVAASIGSSSMTNSGVLLQRPLSSSYLNKIFAESTIQMVVPAIIYEAPTATSGRGCRSSGNTNADGQVSSLDFASLRSAMPRSRPSSSSGGHHGGKQPSNPRQLRPKQTSGSMRIPRDKARGGQTGDEYSSDYDDSFLYLVDAEGDADWPESVSLSPVGPWVVDNFASGVATETPRSPSVSTCHSVSSLGSDDFECNDSGGGGGTWSNTELSAMSPRSRLLYFSACADEVETSRGLFSQLQHQQPLRRSATCGSDLLGNMKLSTATRPKRCSSAKTARHKGRTPNSASFSKGSKPKAPCRPNQLRKRPPSGGATDTS
ncbi:hypothetical protein PHYSODRAFT_515489 [Phytophthora sojae]|uniref:F-box domain-containing protein n=1 Tax=Phytophthora sojae (strain P6497) TaxID=1094619 RepID=G4ZY97_PHYSP|nr:hypothetical protein PHYSODRAFT_515489 [Phytophthora sojae]EGZ12709.1 hypothetical protein PHYSODRAFT_515489 [Phytophthora sojae]|eukprot:XP_009533042.1 hypothetical protein PHYSODRAFT_515489 [Phytophthora sojae]